MSLQPTTRPLETRRPGRVGLGIVIGHPMTYSSATALGVQIKALQQLITTFGSLNLTGQFAGATVSTGLLALLNGLIYVDQGQIADEGQFASQVAGMQATFKAQLAACQNQLQGGTPQTVVATPASPAPSVTTPGGAITASAPTPGAATTTTSGVSAGVTAAVAAGTGLVGGVIGWMARGARGGPRRKR